MPGSTPVCLNRGRHATAPQGHVTPSLERFEGWGSAEAAGGPVRATGCRSNEGGMPVKGCRLGGDEAACAQSGLLADGKGQYARRPVRLTESQAKSRTAPRTVTLALIEAIPRRPRPRRALKPPDIALAALRERRAAQAADHLKMGGCAPGNHHRRRDHGPDLSVLSRNLIGVDSPILGGPVLARRASAAAGERKGECDSVELYRVAAVTFTSFSGWRVSARGLVRLQGQGARWPGAGGGGRASWAATSWRCRIGAWRRALARSAG